MVSIQPIRIEVETEQDGRILAAVPELPGVMAYGCDQEEAIRKVKAIALQVLADMIDSGDEVPESLHYCSRRDRKRDGCMRRFSGMGGR
jgi:predicted RNase H-like HicB family nuclease